MKIKRWDIVKKIKDLNKSLRKSKRVLLEERTVELAKQWQKRQYEKRKRTTC